jgi:DNA-binding Lrp family transcriptional regulator
LIEEAAMDGWWDELDEEILGILRDAGPVDTATLAKKLGMSPEAVCSCLALLSATGRVRIRSADVWPGPDVGAQAA